MSFSFDYRQSESPLIETIWHTRSGKTGEPFISSAEYNLEMVITKQEGKTTFTVRGPDTIAKLAPVPEDAEFFGIVFKVGTFMPHLPTKLLVNADINLPEASQQSVWLKSSAWQLPTFDNADTFIKRLVHDDILVHDPLIHDILQDHPLDLSLRTIQRRFLQATGITQGTMLQIQRAKYATELLQQGTPILDTSYLAGYADQPHLTRSLKRFMGQTPAQILDASLILADSLV